MDTKPAALWTSTVLLIGIPTLVSLWLNTLTDSNLLALIPWVSAPIVGLWLARIWNRRRKLFPPPPVFTPSPLLVEGAFALSGEQFFPLRPGYTEEPPSPPHGPKLATQLSMAWTAVAFGILGVAIPFYMAWASLIALVLSIVNPAGFLGSGKLRSMPIQRLSVLSFFLGLTGLWSFFLTIVVLI